MPQQERSHNFSVPAPQPHERKRPTSERKIRANRRNALNSTGPRTVAGKSYSRRNALNHGLLARVLFRDSLIKREDPEKFKRLYRELEEDLQPCGRAEELEVEQIASCHWKRARLLRYESAEEAFAVDQVAIRGEVSDPRKLLTPDNKALILLLEAAQKEIEDTGEMTPELMDKIFVPKPWLCRLWPELEKKAETILRKRDEEFASSVAQQWGRTSKLTKKILKVQRDRASRAQNISILTIKLAVRDILLWTQKWYQYVLDNECDRQAIPNTDSLDRIHRYSGMVEKDLTRAYDRLERLQRRRKGEPVPPSVNLNLNA